MIKNYKEIYNRVSDKKPVPLAIINPVHNYSFKALENAESMGWIKPFIFKNDTPLVAVREAVTSMENKKPWLLMKGDIDTASMLKAVIDSDLRISEKRLLSHVAVIESPFYNRLIITSDGGVNIAFNKLIISSIIENALVVTAALENHHPNIAALALIENISQKIPETIHAHSILKKYGSDPRFTIEGPIALDVALSQKAAASKGLSSKIAGKTDVFIGPNITTTNFIGKALLGVGNAHGGGIVLGSTVPIVLLSRSDTLETKLNSIALGLLILQGVKNGY
ncbi:phosphate acyltransferase [Candidatus Neomarinimicrobiota bacterium]